MIRGRVPSGSFHPRGSQDAVLAGLAEQLKARGFEDADLANIENPHFLKVYKVYIAKVKSMDQEHGLGWTKLGHSALSAEGALHFDTRRDRVWITRDTLPNLTVCGRCRYILLITHCPQNIKFRNF